MSRSQSWAQRLDQMQLYRHQRGRGRTLGHRGNSRETIIVLAVQLCCPHCLCFCVRVIFSIVCKYQERESVVPAPPVSNVGSNSQDDEVILLHRGPDCPALTSDHNNVTMFPPRGPLPSLPWPLYTHYTFMS